MKPPDSYEKLPMIAVIITVWGAEVQLSIDCLNKCPGEAGPLFLTMPVSDTSMCPQPFLWLNIIGCCWPGLRLHRIAVPGIRGVGMPTFLEKSSVRPILVDKLLEYYDILA